MRDFIDIIILNIFAVLLLVNDAIQTYTGLLDVISKILVIISAAMGIIVAYRKIKRKS